MARLEQQMLEDTIWLRREFFRRVPVLKMEEICLAPAVLDCGGLAAVERWRAERRILGVNHGDLIAFPAFQFESDRTPKSSMGELLEIFARYQARTDWDNALWFMAPNGWLDGATPIDLLDQDPDLVKDAALQAVLPHIE